MGRPEHDPGSGIRRTRRSQLTAKPPAPGIAPARRVKVKGVGRYTQRHWCPVCGAKLRECRCGR